jgi:predicted  nucleic acid-binding Zn ribbon protein
MKVESRSKLMQYHQLEQYAPDVSISDTLDNEIECPRCHEVMTLFSGFDFLYYHCEECRLPLYTSSNHFVKLR